jgi:hypothetical protein
MGHFIETKTNETHFLRICTVCFNSNHKIVINRATNAAKMASPFSERGLQILKT